ncbi:MAG: hypothetical protein FWD57_11305, partial [Polyangiaceae bacterium]|nr:hypothetical protein [Polyangiaceae bacterium]
MTQRHRDYRNLLNTFGGGMGGRSAVEYCDRVDAELDSMVSRMAELARNEKGISYAKGDIAEAWHAGTLNVDAARRGINVSATLPRDASPVDISIRGSR